MRRTRLGALIAVASLPVSWIVLAASAETATNPAPPTSAAAPCETLPGPVPQVPPRALDSVGLNFTNEMLEPGDSAAVEVCALVDSLGIVREAHVARGGTPYDSAVVDAARWWWFRPARRDGHPVAARVVVHVTAQPPREAEPLVPDVFEIAHAAEAQGDARGALDAWTGALWRAASRPQVGNEWVIRERIVRLAAAMREPPAVPLAAMERARGAHNVMLRDMSRGTNADLAGALDVVLREVPWFTDAYRWRASARAASGQVAGALRDVLCYRLATRDSMGRVVADRALAALARGDTLSAFTLLKY